MLIYLGTGERGYGDRPVHPQRRRWWEFQSVVTGRCGQVTPGEPVTLRPRTLWVSPPEHLHGWTGAPGEVCQVLVFQFDTVPELLRQELARRGGMSVNLSAEDVRRLRGLAALVRPEHERPTALSALRFDRAMLALSELALRHLEGAPPPSPADAARQKVAAALTWYAEHMVADPAVAQVARAVCVSPSHLRRLFHATRGESPLDAMRRVRIERAKELLDQSGLPIKVVAEACGFSSVSVFSRGFKAGAGIPPSVWQARRFATSNRPGPSRSS